MAVLFQIRNAYKAFGDQVLLDNAEATITDDAKIGFVGRNGAGKSTLLKILLGEEELDAGEVIRHPRLRVGYLRQHDPFQDGESAMDFLMRDSEQPDWKCGEVAGQFELKGDYLFGPVKSLSGGWQTRVKLAALLLHEPNLLLLDEPTNFLDLRTQILLEHFLQNFKQACLMVSHDRTFLAKTCQHTLDLSSGKLTMYPGKIAKFLEFQEERNEQALRENTANLAKQKQLEAFINKNRANANTASQARSKQKQLDRLQLQIKAVATHQATAYIQAPVVSPIKGTAVRCEGLAIGYPDHEVANDIQLEIEHQQRAAIVGDNGQGKTTLLRTLVGSLDPKGGSLRWGHNINIGTYAQHVYTSLDPTDTVLEYLDYQAMPGTTDQQVLAVAGSLLFRDEHVHKKVKVLSGGERARLCMAGLLLGDYNVLVLDEPGNHLDVETVEALAEALLIYKGTVIFTSHDRHFMSRVATTVIEVRDGTARDYMNDYKTYLQSINKEIEQGERSTSSKNGPKENNPKSGAVSQNDQRALRKKIKAIERKIASLDDQKKALAAEMATTTDAAKALELHEQIEAITGELTAAENEWLELN